MIFKRFTIIRVLLVVLALFVLYQVTASRIATNAEEKAVITGESEIG